MDALLSVSEFNHERVSMSCLHAPEANNLTDNNNLPEANNLTDNNNLPEANNLTDNNNLPEANNLTDNNNLPEANNLTDNNNLQRNHQHLPSRVLTAHNTLNYTMSL